MWPAGFTQEETGKNLNIDQKTVSNTIDDFRKKLQMQEIPKDFESQLYDVWNFYKATNQIAIVNNPDNINNMSERIAIAPCDSGGHLSPDALTFLFIKARYG